MSEKKNITEIESVEEEEEEIKELRSKEDIDWEVRYNLEAPYRFKTSTQVIIYIIAVLSWLFVLLATPMPEYLPKDTITPKLIMFLLFSSVFWTIIVKDRSPIFRQIGNGLLLATILPTVTFVINISLLANIGEDAIIETAGLTLATILIFVMSIYGHVNPGLPSNRNFMLIAVVVGCGLFFISLLLFFWTYGMLFAVSASIIMTLIFLYAVFPEPED